VLAKASFATGALTMLAFALGTLPALLSLSAMSSFATGTFQKSLSEARRGLAVVVLGVLNIQYWPGAHERRHAFGAGGHSGGACRLRCLNNRRRPATNAGSR